MNVSERTQSLLDRVPNHPSAAMAKRAMTDALAAAEAFAAHKARMATEGKLTSMGQKEELRQALSGEFGKAVARARDPIAKAQKDLKARRERLVIKSVDPSNLAAALERQEIRGSLDMNARQSIALTTNDRRVLDAMVTAPPELSGFTGNLAQVAEQVEARYLELTYGNEIAEIEATEAVLAEADAALQIARNDLMFAAEIEHRDFETVMRPIENGLGRPWLKREGARVVVVNPGESSYPDATPHDLATGVYYESGKEFLAANGFDSIEGYMASIGKTISDLRAA